MASKDKRPAKTRPGGIRTLSDLNRADSDSDSDAPQEYYTGGEKSGMLVQDPTKGNNNKNDVDSIFDQARELGAVEGPIIDPNSVSASSSSSSRSFTGTGRLLSGETVQSALAAPQQPATVVHNIIFWADDGFSVDDGPLRRMDDPANAPFLESILKSECPKELEPEDRNATVHVNLIKRNEKYPETVKRQVAFHGVGRTLGSSSSAPVASEPTASSSTAPTSSQGLVVDENLPTTSIQLRLADGTRMIAQLNYHHTVSDIRQFVNTTMAGSQSNYQLQMMGFPPKILNDPAQTIEQAGLANSVVIQKF